MLHADHRVLAITINLSGHMIGFASLHAPDTTKGAVTNEWWCNACAILRRCPVDVVPWIGIDANIALPEVWAVAVSRVHEPPVRCSDSARRASVHRKLAAVHGHRGAEANVINCSRRPQQRVSQVRCPRFPSLVVSSSGDLWSRFRRRHWPRPVRKRFSCPYDGAGWLSSSLKTDSTVIWIHNRSRVCC